MYYRLLHLLPRNMIWKVKQQGNEENSIVSYSGPISMATISNWRAWEKEMRCWPNILLWDMRNSTWMGFSGILVHVTMQHWQVFLVSANVGSCKAVPVHWPSEEPDLLSVWYSELLRLFCHHNSSYSGDPLKSLNCCGTWSSTLSWLSLDLWLVASSLWTGILNSKLKLALRNGWQLLWLRRLYLQLVEETLYVIGWRDFVCSWLRRLCL